MPTGRILIERLDGLGMEFDDWRFNLRLSNTEPVVRLNVESRGDEALMKAKTEELLALIGANVLFFVRLMPGHRRLPCRGVEYGWVGCQLCSSSLQ